MAGTDDTGAAGTPPVATPYGQARVDERLESLGRRLAAVEFATANRRTDAQQVHAFVWGVIFGVIIVTLIVRAVLAVDRWRPPPTPPDPREDLSHDRPR